MKNRNIVPLDEEIHFDPDEIIVSKTDSKGHIVYANDIFCRVAEMSTQEVIGQPHNIIRHPDMPRAVFKLLWERLLAQKEILAYVKNMSLTGKYYWVIAHVTPSYGQDGTLAGFHSNRRVPNPQAISDIRPLYRDLLRIEKENPDRKASLIESAAFLEKTAQDVGQTYDEFIWSKEACNV